MKNLGYVVRLAVIVTGGRRLDDVLYSYLGRAGVKERATMGDMLNPRTSVVLSSQQAYLWLLLHCDGATPEWNLLKSIGADFKDEALRQFTRQQLIGYSMGLLCILIFSGAYILGEHRLPV